MALQQEILMSVLSKSGASNSVLKSGNSNDLLKPAATTQDKTNYPGDTQTPAHSSMLKSARLSNSSLLDAGNAIISAKNYGVGPSVDANQR